MNKSVTFELRFLLVIISLLAPTSLIAQTEKGHDTLQSIPSLQQQPQLSTDPLDLDIGEMVFDETITRVGKDFYNEFYTNWSNPSKISDFSVSIKERPLPSMGTQITVQIDDYVLVEQFIRLNQELIEMLAEYTVRMASQYLLNDQEIQNQLQNADQAGTGIF